MDIFKKPDLKSQRDAQETMNKLKTSEALFISNINALLDQTINRR